MIIGIWNDSYAKLIFSVVNNSKTYSIHRNLTFFYGDIVIGFIVLKSEDPAAVFIFYR
mgnify:CR=1 FL=1